MMRIIFYADRQTFRMSTAEISFFRILGSFSPFKHVLKYDFEEKPKGFIEEKNNFFYVFL